MKNLLSKNRNYMQSAGMGSGVKTPMTKSDRILKSSYHISHKIGEADEDP